MICRWRLREIDPIVVDDADAPHSRGGEVEEERAAETASADHQHLGRLEPRLPHAAQLGQDDVASIAADLRLRQLIGRH